jgi:hypothetical protein
MSSKKPIYPIPPGEVDTQIETSNFNAYSGVVYLIDSSVSPITVVLPPPALRTTMTLKDYKFSSSINNITIHRYGTEKIENSASDYIINTNGACYRLVSDGTDWCFI